MPTAARSYRAQPPIRLRRAGKAWRGRPGSQETCLRPQAHKPSRKGVGSMLVSRRVCPAPGGASAGFHTALRVAPLRRVAGMFAAAAVGICTVLTLSSTALATPITVDLRVEGSAKTVFEGPTTTSPETIETA